MKLALEAAALLIFFLCFSTALKAFLHLRHHELRRLERAMRHPEPADRRGPLDRAA